MKKLDFVFLINIFFCVGCDQLEYREALNSHKNDFLSKSLLGI